MSEEISKRLRKTYTVELEGSEVAMITTALMVFTHAFIEDFTNGDDPTEYPDGFLDKALLDITATRMKFSDMFREAAEEYISVAKDLNARDDLIEGFQQAINNLQERGEI